MALIGVLCFSACSPYKSVPKNRYLLKKNKIKIIDKVNNPSLTEIEGQITTKPNRKVMGIYRFHLRAYNLGTSKRKPNKNETKKLRKFLRNKVGEAPILLDSQKIQKSARNIEQLFFNNGYFNNKVSIKIDSIGKRRRKAVVTYIINPGKMFLIKSNVLLADEFLVDSVIESSKANTLLKPNIQSDFSVLTQERNRITEHLNNNGFFYFGKEYIEFDLDTSESEVNIRTVILNDIDYPTHRRVKYDNVLIKFPVLSSYDSSNIIEQGDGMSFKMNGYPLKKSLLEKRILSKKGRWYSKAEMDKTFALLTELKIFQSIDIFYYPSAQDSANKIDVIIELSPYKKQSYSIEPQGVISYDIQTLVQTNQNRNLGVGNVLNYTNRNVFGGAEQFTLTSITSFQAQIGGRNNTNFEQSVNARLSFPGSNLLKKLERNEKILNLSTQINLAYIFQQNNDFRRNIIPVNYSYLINKKNNNNWLITPIELNFNRSEVNHQFFQSLNQDQKDFLNILFARNFLLSSHLTYFTSKTAKKKPNKTYFIKSNILELGGNSLYALSSIIGAPRDTNGTYELLGVPFSQFARTDIDLRLTHKLNQNNTMVYRLNTGIAVPFGNRDFLPVDKRYFIGGANSLRGWNPRGIGPGNNTDQGNTNSLDRTAELLILANLEYRFRVVRKTLEMALFLDGGNVWNVVEGNDPKEKFKFNSFLESSALNTGVGMRFNFQFFLLRLDWAIRMYNPSLQNNRWVINEIGNANFINRHTLLNIGLDYPF